MQATRPRQYVDPRMAPTVLLAAATFAVGIFLGSTLDLAPRSTTVGAAAPVTDHSYDAIEGARIQRTLNAPDVSYDAVEHLRGANRID